MKGEGGLSGVGGRGYGALLHHGHSVSVSQDEQHFGDGWWSWLYNNINVLIPLNYIFKNG